MPMMPVTKLIMRRSSSWRVAHRFLAAVAAGCGRGGAPLLCEGFDQPARRAQEPRIVAAAADQLHPERHAVLALHQRQRHGRRAEIGPGGAEHRVARAVEAARRLAGRGRGEDGIVFVEDSSSASLSGAIAATARGVVDRRIRAAALDQLAQRRAELVAALLVVAMEVVGHLDLHDDAMQLDGAVEARAELDLGRRLAERLDQLAERLAASPARRASQAGERTKAKRGGNGGSLAADGGERRTRHRPRVGVLLVEAGQRLGQQRGVLDRARKDADMVERARQHAARRCAESGRGSA